MTPYTYRLGDTSGPSGRFPDLRSRRDAAGHDAGRIHATRPAAEPARYDTACGLTIGQYGTVTHAIGPTCRPCKAAMR